MICRSSDILEIWKWSSTIIKHTAKIVSLQNLKDYVRNYARYTKLKINSSGLRWDV